MVTKPQRHWKLAVGGGIALCEGRKEERKEGRDEKTGRRKGGRKRGRRKEGRKDGRRKEGRKVKDGRKDYIL
jgi:hypothetical protein